MGDATGAGRKDAPTGAPHPPQNFVVLLTGAPHALQIFWAGWDCAGAGARAATVAPQIPQNFSVPVMGLPHDAQT